MTIGEPPARARAAIGPALLRVLEIANRPDVDPPARRFDPGWSVGPRHRLVLTRQLRFDGLSVSPDHLHLEDHRTAEHFDADGRLPVYLVPWLAGDASATMAVLERLSGYLDGEAAAHPHAGAVTARVDPAQLAELMNVPDVAAIELSPETDVSLLDTAIPQVLQSGRSSLGTAAGVRVAVLDGGIDSNHPALDVADVRNTSAEPHKASIHGTHVAGCLASNDARYRGIAPDVTLFDVKVARANNRASWEWISKGIDVAIDELDADILSLSVGLSPLPTFTHAGWTCPIVLGDGQLRPCPLCQRTQRAIENGVLVVAAAGNFQGSGSSRSPEMACPAQATGVITVAAVDDNGALAPFSSRGPSRLPGAGITLAAPGCGIRSTVPTSEPSPFAEMSGTSQAAPLVAGALAVLLAHQDDPDPIAARKAALHQLMSAAIAPSNLPTEEVGAGLLCIPAIQL